MSIRLICFKICLALISTLCLVPVIASAQMVSGPGMPGFAQALGLTNADFEVQQLGAEGSTNVLGKNESLKASIRFVNKTDKPLSIDGRWRIVGYRTEVPAGDIWVPHVFRIDETRGPKFSILLSPKGDAIVPVMCALPHRYGGYALVADAGGVGSAFAGTFTRTVGPDPGRVWQPSYALDMPWPFEMCPGVTQTFLKLGVKGCRMGVSYTPTTSPNFQSDLSEIDRFLKWSQAANVSVMLTLGAGSAPQPLGRTRPWLTSDGTMIPNIKEDYAWLPEYDPDFRKWVKLVCSKYGYPKGPVNAVQLWNEPWEGVSISGWGADMLRYREIYKQMALGVLDARRESGVQVLIGGADSSSNTLDKLFPDGSDEFLPYLDFVSIHYQGLGSTPCLVPQWMDRKVGYGKVKVWDTESWVGNSEDRVPGVVASMRSFGQDRAMGIFGGDVYTSESHDVAGKNYRTIQSWPPAAAVAAAAKFVGQRAFQGLVFPKGLPWVYEFATKDAPDNGTLVVLGDLGALYQPNAVLYRAAQMDLEDRPGWMTIHPDPSFRLLDCYGNVLADGKEAIKIRLDRRGVYLRTDGTIGSFKRLIAAVKSARITGVTPVEIVAHDFLKPVPDANLRLSLTNVINRVVTGRLVGLIGNISFKFDLKLQPNATLEFAYPVNKLLPSSENLYPLNATFISANYPTAKISETLHCNVIAHKTIKIDGADSQGDDSQWDDSQWDGVMPHTVTAEAIKATVTETAWLPFKKYPEVDAKGLATIHLAYDDSNFYFSAKIHDVSPYEGNIRFANRNDDEFFYPQTSYQVKDGKREALEWPAGVRRYTYRKDALLPTGSDTDNVQIAFNVLAPDEKYWKPKPPGVMDRYMAYPDTDYEFALNQVAPAFGGGTEVWRLLAPGIPRKHFYPRQPKAPVDGGAVTNARLVIRRDSNWRYVTASIPWAEIPDVRKTMLAGKTIKFSFRVNDNAGPSYELAQGRSVSKINYPAFHNDWQEHWANEVEFSFQPK